MSILKQLQEGLKVILLTFDSIAKEKNGGKKMEKVPLEAGA